MSTYIAVYHPDDIVHIYKDKCGFFIDARDIHYTVYIIEYTVKIISIENMAALSIHRNQKAKKNGPKEIVLALFLALWHFRIF